MTFKFRQLGSLADGIPAKLHALAPEALKLAGEGLGISTRATTIAFFRSAEEDEASDFTAETDFFAGMRDGRLMVHADLEEAEAVHAIAHVLATAEGLEDPDEVAKAVCEQYGFTEFEACGYCQDED